MRRWFARLADGFDWITLDPLPRHRLSAAHPEPEQNPPVLRWGPLPPLPDSAYGPDAVPLDCSGVPEWYGRVHELPGPGAEDGSEEER
jgi:hypothetical protein